MVAFAHRWFIKTHCCFIFIRCTFFTQFFPHNVTGYSLSGLNLRVLCKSRDASVARWLCILIISACAIIINRSFANECYVVKQRPNNRATTKLTYFQSQRLCKYSIFIPNHNIRYYFLIKSSRDFIVDIYMM